METIPVGLMFANGGRGAQPEHVRVLVEEAESLRYESLWAVQHVVMPLGYESRYPYSVEGTIPGGEGVPIPDPLVWLAFAGALTSRIRLATGVLVLPQQHPLIVAKQVATLDRLTRGRVILGVGAGWLREEFEALDADFDHRGSRLEEDIHILRLAWTGEAAYQGSARSFGPVRVEPTPASRVPIVIGGHTPTAARRAGAMADGFFPLACQGQQLIELSQILRRAAEEAGREPDSIEITAEAPRSATDVDAQRKAGVGRVVVNAPHVPTDQLREALAERLETIQRRLAS